MQIISNSKVHPAIIMIGINHQSNPIFFLGLCLNLSFFCSYYTHEMAFNYGNYDRANDRYMVCFLSSLFIYLFIYW